MRIACLDGAAIAVTRVYSGLKGNDLGRGRRRWRVGVRDVVPLIEVKAQASRGVAEGATYI